MARSFVVNASPLILLARIGRLDLLTSLAEHVAVPERVRQEVAAGGERDDTLRAVAALSAIRAVPDVEVPERLDRWDLGPGETQVLSYALANQGFEAVIDDRAARRCGRSLGVPYIGTLGIVILCRRQGLIPAARPILEALWEQGIHLSKTVAWEALAKVGE